MNKNTSLKIPLTVLGMIWVNILFLIATTFKNSWKHSWCWVSVSQSNIYKYLKYSHLRNTLLVPPTFYSHLLFVSGSQSEEPLRSTESRLKMSKVYFELWILQSFKKKTVEQETSDPLCIFISVTVPFMLKSCAGSIFSWNSLCSVPFPVSQSLPNCTLASCSKNER